jgi:3'-5' exoribonuclease
MIIGDQACEDAQASHLWVKDIKENDFVKGLYLAKAKKMGLTKRNDPFLSLTLSDRSGDLETKVWDNAEASASLFNEGDILEVEGSASSYRSKIQLTLSGLKVCKEEVDPSIFIESTPFDVDEMMRSLKQILTKVEGRYLKALVEKFLADREFIARFKESPAAKNFHHGYMGGLLEHTLSVCRLAVFIAEHYPQLDRDMLISGAFLHDIGKIKEFKTHISIDYTDEGRLLGHLVLGVNMVNEKIDSLKNFPTETALRLKHMILSHHGEYDFGSPKRPKFIEAFALHSIDDLDAKVNGLGRIMARDPKEGNWTDFNRLFERYLLKGSIEETQEEENSKSLSDGDRQKSLFEF